MACGGGSEGGGGGKDVEMGDTYGVGLGPAVNVS